MWCLWQHISLKCSFVYAKSFICMWCLWQHISLKWSFEYAQIIYLHVMFVTTNFLKCTNHSFACDVCDSTLLLNGHLNILKLFICMWYLWQNIIFNMHKLFIIIHLHVIFVTTHFFKMVIEICTNHSIKCDICFNTFL